MTIKKIYCCQYQHLMENILVWFLTDDEEYAEKHSQQHTLATLDDLEEWFAAGQVFKGVVAIVEGHFQWYEEKSYNEWGDLDEYTYEYRKIA